MAEPPQATSGGEIVTDPWSGLSDEELAVRLAGSGCPWLACDILLRHRDSEQGADLIQQWLDQKALP